MSGFSQQNSNQTPQSAWENSAEDSPKTLAQSTVNNEFLAEQPFSALRVLGVFLLGISVGISLMYFYMQVRNPDPLAELKQQQDVIISPLDGQTP
ncbi:MAG: hypothetical protein ACFCU1_13780 [Sumerlaeia bacterium]